MENQHRKIDGYRELSQAEIDLMNRVKRLGSELLDLHQEIVEKLTADQLEKCDAAACNTDEYAEFDRFMTAEPLRWAAIAKTDIQTGVMALVRAVAQPAD